MKKKLTMLKPRLLSVKELGGYLSFPESTIYKMVQKNEIPFIRVGEKSIRFDLDKIDRWVDQHYNKGYFRN